MRKIIMRGLLLSTILTICLVTKDAFALTITEPANKIEKYSSYAMTENATMIPYIVKCDSQEDYSVDVYVDGAKVNTETGLKCNPTDDGNTITYVSNNYLTNKSEFTIAVYKSGTQEGFSTDFLFYETGKELNDSNGIMKINANVPINTTFSTKKITDSSILNKYGSNYVYGISLLSDEKDMSYYKNKYGYEISVSSAQAVLPSGLTKAEDLYLYLVNSDDENSIATMKDCSGILECGTIDGVFDGNYDSKYFYGKGIMFFKNGVYQHNDDDNETTNSNAQVVKVGNTASRISIGVFIIGMLALIVGIYTTYKATKKEKVEE